MTFDRVDIGHVELLALLDGVGEDEPITDAFPDAPADELLSYRDRYPGVYAENGRWQLWIRAWLIRHPGGVILVDTGIGRAGAPGPAWFGAPGLVPDALRETGTPPDAVDTVVLTHVHDDHIGGTVVFEPGDDGPVPVPAFPSARYVLQRADLEWERRAAGEDEEDAVIWRRLLAPLEDAGLLDPIEGDHELAEGIQAHLAPGHTPGHQVVRIASAGHRAIVTADAFNHPAQLAHPDWPSGSDALPAQAAASRRALLAELVSHPGTTVAPTHFAESFGEVASGRDGLAGWTPR